MKPYPNDPRYAVTEDGRVFRIEAYRFGRKVPFQMKPRPDKDGYVMVGWIFKVHRLVAETYIPNPLGLPQVAHWDGDRANNHVSNLRWATVSENHFDKRRHKTQLWGEKSHFHKLTGEQVKEARERAAAGESHTSIADDMPVCRSVLSRAIRKDTWAHV